MISSEKKEAFSPLKFEVEVEMGMEMEMGRSWNEQGYRLQHQHFQERPTINKKKNPACTASSLFSFRTNELSQQNPPLKKPSTQKFSQTHTR